MQLRVTVALVVAVAAACTPRYHTHLKPICPPARDSTRIGPQTTPRNAITGELTDRDTGRPLKSGSVTTAPSSGTSRLTDSLGRFQLIGLRPRQYVVRARRIGYEERTDTVAISTDAGVHMHLALTPAYVDRCMELRQVRTLVPWWHFW